MVLVLGAVLLAPAAAAHAEHRTLAVVAGTNVPINGFNYNAGIGVRLGTQLRGFYLGGMLAIHMGDEKEIRWGASGGAPAGTQTYSSTPVILAGDAGYVIGIPIAGRRTELTPYVSGGLVATRMASSGVYGDPSTTRLDPVVGFGFTYLVPITERWLLGVHQRMYSVGDVSFDYGDADAGEIEHGFRTSIFYAGFYAEAGYRF